MPLQYVETNGMPGYRWGDSGEVYTYDAKDPISKAKAKAEARQDGETIKVNKGSQINTAMYDGEIFNIKKFYDDEQLVFGWASVAKDKDGTRPIEWQGDEIEAHEMEPAVYDFVLQQGITKEMHRAEKAKGQVVESLIFTKEKMKAMGIPEGTVPEGWWVGFKVSDKDTFMKVKAGIYKMFSIEGKGVRTPIGGD